MRNTFAVISILVAAAVGPTLVFAAPSVPNTNHVGGLASEAHMIARYQLDDFDSDRHTVSRFARQLPAGPGSVGGLGGIPGLSSLSSILRKRDDNRKVVMKLRRAGDWGTAGGNAYTGATSDASGGSIINAAGDDGTEGDSLTNTGANRAGDSGTSQSGGAQGGNGRGHGPGGNAYTGSTGKAHGGNVINEGAVINNGPDMDAMTESNTAGNGNTSQSGDAIGGDSDDDTTDD